MRALVTGASSGIGQEIARELSKRGFELILAARRGDRLEKLAAELPTKTEVIPIDLSKPENCIQLHKMCGDIDVLINNAGFGVFGEFDKTDMDLELEMINLNITAMHILMKLFLKDFKAKNSGYILNTASSAAFFPGPMFSGYYASKAYVYRMTQAIHRELKTAGSKVSVSVLCPGPVSTEFGDVAKVHFHSGISKSKITAEYVAKLAVDKMLKKKLVIVPGTLMKITRFLSKILPERTSSVFVEKIQSGKKIQREQDWRQS